MNSDEREIETMKMAIVINRRFSASVPAGADKKTEARIAKDEARLAELQAQTEKKS